MRQLSSVIRLNTRQDRLRIPDGFDKLFSVEAPTTCIETHEKPCVLQEPAWTIIEFTELL